KSVMGQTRLKDVIVVDLKGEPRGLDWGHHSFGDFIRMDADPAPEVEINPLEDVAVLQYTGGTTGVSKGAMLTHFNLVANTQQGLDLLVDDPGAFSNNQKIVAVLPFFHVYGLSCVMLFGIRQGLNQLLLPRFDAREVMELVKNERPVAFAGVPTMYMALLLSSADLREYGFDKVRTYSSGGAALPVNVLRAFEDRTGRPVFEGYGLSEASPVTHFNPTFTGRGREGSIGVPLPSTDARIVDVETGARELPIGKPGELVIRGPQVMKGYWNMPEETAHALRDGWLYTGDVARMDEDGYFYVVDRKKDMIVTGSYNVYPREVEEVLFEHEGVAEAVAIGVSDEYRGETVKAFVVREPGSEVTEEEILAFCKERLAPYKTPQALEFRDELPRSAVGKLLRRVLAEEERTKAGAAPAPPSPS
ncbi:MAG TPA: long-chain fatty acid--CoA ligase, partial [Rubrobacteraceae bacterium]|nr:long-chain fatty acid--CoA ligase [Rubrobacteraceae bacterium]